MDSRLCTCVYYAVPMCVYYAVPMCVYYAVPMCVYYAVPMCVYYAVPMCVYYAVPMCVYYAVSMCVYYAVPMCVYHAVPIIALVRVLRNQSPCTDESTVYPVLYCAVPYPTKLHAHRVNIGDRCMLAVPAQPTCKCKLSWLRLCPYPGDGWSSRAEDAILHGCIPLVVGLERRIEDCTHALVPSQSWLSYSCKLMRKCTRITLTWACSVHRPHRPPAHISATPELLMTRMPHHAGPCVAAPCR